MTNLSFAKWSLTFEFFLLAFVGLCRPLLAFCGAGSLWWELDLDPGWWLKRQHPAASKSNKQERGCNSNKSTKCLGSLLLIVVTSKSLFLFLIILLKITLGSSQLCCNFLSICVLKVLCILGEGQQTLCPTKLSHPAQTPPWIHNHQQNSLNLPLLSFLRIYILQMWPFIKAFKNYTQRVTLDQKTMSFNW